MYTTALRRKLPFQSGHDVAVVGTASAAADSCGERFYDPILLDLGLPGGGAVELVTPAWRRGARVLVCSGFGGAGAVAASLAAGAADHVVKPISGRALLDAVGRVLASPLPPTARAARRSRAA